jgi:hypothetical protein
MSLNIWHFVLPVADFSHRFSLVLVHYFDWTLLANYYNMITIALHTCVKFIMFGMLFD